MAFEGNKNPNQLLFSDTMHHIRVANFLRWGDIYRILKDKDCPKPKEGEYEDVLLNQGQRKTMMYMLTSKELVSTKLYLGPVPCHIMA